jgi:hypothetical protein
MPVNLNSAFAKLERAAEHTNAIEQLIIAWKDRNPYRLVPEHNHNATRISIRIRIDKAPDVTLWSLIFSDAIHNYRCVLDHLIYGIATSIHDPVPARIARNAGFPICDTADNFTGQRHRISFAPQRVRDTIEQLQPYNRWTHPEAPPVLSMLRDLNDIDKHRLLRMALAQVTEGTFSNMRVNVARVEPYSLVSNSRDLVDGAEIVSLTFSRPQLDLHYDFEAVIQIVMNHPPALGKAGRSEVVGLLKAIDAEVRDVVAVVRNSI